MPLTVMRSVKSELLTPGKGQTAGWEYLLRMFLTSKIFTLLLPSSCSGQSSVLGAKGHKSLVIAHSSSSKNTNHTGVGGTNSVNAKMLMPTFTRGCKVGLFKQRVVCKVKKRIIYSNCASEVCICVGLWTLWTDIIIPDSSTKCRNLWAALCHKQKRHLKLKFTIYLFSVNSVILFGARL